MTDHSNQLFANDFVFLEGPRWHDGSLWLSDMWDNSIIRLSPNGEKSIVANVPNRPSGLGFLPDNSLLVASMLDRMVYKVESGKLKDYADLSPLVSGDINDMVVDGSGRAYVGNFGFDLFNGASPSLAEIVIIDRQGKPRVVADNLKFPNGMVITNQGKQLVVAETFGSRLTSFDIDDNGDLSNQQVYAELEGLTPDGICLDAEGSIWISSYATGDFARVSQNGKIVEQFKVDGAAVACQLGGVDLKTLYCIVTDVSEEGFKEGKRLSRIETRQVTSAGVCCP